MTSEREHNESVDSKMLRKDQSTVLLFFLVTPIIVAEAWDRDSDQPACVSQPRSWSCEYVQFSPVTFGQ